MLALLWSMQPAQLLPGTTSANLLTWLVCMYDVLYCLNLQYVYDYMCYIR